MTDIIEPAAPAVEQPTAEQIAQHYSAAMDSVNLITIFTLGPIIRPINTRL
jgi:hypothetical protein